MKLTKQARREAKQLLRACQVDGRLDDGRVRQAVESLIAGRPRGYVGILAQFQRLVKLELDRRAVRIETAVPLPAPAQASVQENLTRLYGPGLTFTYAENPALLGGMRIRVGSDVYDGSIHGRLTELEESL